MNDSSFSLIEVVKEGEVMGWGVEFPSGQAYIEWNRMRFPKGDRLQEPHISEYGSMSDLEKATGGIPKRLVTQPATEVDE